MSDGASWGHKDLRKDPELSEKDLRFLYGPGYKMAAAACSAGGAELATQAAAVLPLRMPRTFRGGEDHTGLGYRDSAADRDANQFRWSYVTRLRRDTETDPALAKPPLQLSCATWNSGQLRGGMLQEYFRGGSFHVSLMQECDPQIQGLPRVAMASGIQHFAYSLLSSVQGGRIGPASLMPIDASGGAHVEAMRRKHEFDRKG